MAIVALLTAACGPQPATPTPKGAAGTTPTAKAAASADAETTVAVPLESSTLPVDPDDWHALGPEDAKVTIIEFSEFM